jgi:hypothetical protein
MQAVGELCDEALVVKGTPRFQGPVGDAVACYLSLANGDTDRYVGEGLRILATSLLDDRGEPVQVVSSGARLTLEVELEATAALGPQNYSMVVYRATDGLRAADVSFSADDLGLRALAAGDRVRLSFAHVAHLARGQYTYEVNVWDPVQARHRLLSPDIAGLRVDEYRSWSGVADLEVRAALHRRAAALVG